MANHNVSLKKAAAWAAMGAGVYLAALLYKSLKRFTFEGKVVLITGGSRGLGLILARQLAAKGAKLAICARTVHQLGQAHVELEAAGAEVMSLKVDVTDAEQVQQMVNDVVAHYGRLDVLINNAGVIQIGPQDAMELKDYELAMKSNFWSALYTMLAVIPHFKKQRSGRIVNITSIGGKIAVPHLLPYTASKFALVGLSEGMHAALHKHGIGVTTVVPNLMRTGSPRNAIVKGQHEAEYAWFKLADAAPVLSQDAEKAARRIIRAVTYNESEAMLSPAVSLASFVKGISPDLIAGIMKLVEALLPDNPSGTIKSKKGFESESALSLGVIGALSDRAAVRNNEY